jgi:hypothetical protein
MRVRVSEGRVLGLSRTARLRRRCHANEIAHRPIIGGAASFQAPAGWGQPALPSHHAAGGISPAKVRHPAAEGNQMNPRIKR